jgi:hypothetical protein
MCALIFGEELTAKVVKSSFVLISKGTREWNRTLSSQCKLAP